jgi:uroporphyrinogen III methyltransferase/synthase
MAVRSLALFDWIVLSGGRCVRTFADRLVAGGLTLEALREIRVCALGRGAVLTLRDLGIAMDCIPRVHTPEGIRRSLGELRGLRFLLIRFEGAPAGLRRVLREGGASVAWASGGRLEVEADPRLAWRAFGRKPDAIALASPMAVQYFAQGLELCGPELAEEVRGIPVAAIGPATAERAREIGLEPSLVSKGHLVDVAEDQAGASALPL